MIPKSRTKPTAAPLENVRATPSEISSRRSECQQPLDARPLADGHEQAERDEHQHDLGVAVLLADVAREAELGGRAEPGVLDADRGLARLGETEVGVVVGTGRVLIEGQGSQARPDRQQDPDDRDDRLPRPHDVRDEEVEPDPLEHERHDRVECGPGVGRCDAADEVDEQVDGDPGKRARDDDVTTFEHDEGGQRRDEQRGHGRRHEARDIVEAHRDDAGVAVEDRDHDQGRHARADEDRHPEQGRPHEADGKERAAHRDRPEGSREADRRDRCHRRPRDRAPARVRAWLGPALDRRDQLAERRDAFAHRTDSVTVSESCSEAAVPRSASWPLSSSRGSPPTPAAVVEAPPGRSRGSAPSGRSAGPWRCSAAPGARPG